jgi:predicted nucleic acid-binding protein
MTGRSFVDTNVIVYLFDDGEPAKQEQARRLIADPESPPLVVSTQVLAECYVTLTRKLAHPLDLPSARIAIERLAEWPVVQTDTALVLAAIATCEQEHLSFWDAMIIEAAATADCDRLITEDLQDGAAIRGVQIENPFRSFD